MNDQAEDLTGRKRLGWNVAVTWLGQVVVIASGFVIPRLIDEQLSQEALGIWDFGWSTVTYFRLLGLGLGGGLNRYVAYYRSQGATDDLTRAVSSTAFLQVLVAAATVSMAYGIGFAAELLFDDESATLAQSGQWLITFLGAGLGIRMLCWPARGVLTGYHLWATNSAITATGDILLLALMIANLAAGGGLMSLGLAYLATSLLTETLRTIAARRVYGQRFLIWSRVDRRMLKKLVVFGVKTNLVGLPLLVVVQTVSLLLAAFAGPAALAVYTRPLALTRHAQTIVMKFANILTSTTAGLQGLGRGDEVRAFFIEGTRSAFAISLPLLLIVGIYGDVLVRVWMGPEYVDPLLSPLFALGLVLPYANAAAMRVLIGLNAHGKAAMLSLGVASLVLIIGVAVTSAVGWSPRTAAMIVGASLSCGPGVVVPIATCRILKVKLLDYFRGVFVMPLCCGSVFAAILLLPRLYLEAPSLIETIVIVAVGGLVLSVLYWFALLKPETRRDVSGRLRLRARPARG